MAQRPDPDRGLFLHILATLERLDVPDMLVGTFDAPLYGLARVTFDIDLLVDLAPNHIDALVNAYSPPRYYADRQQMLEGSALGTMFDIIDTDRGEKADMIPLSMDQRYAAAFARRLRQGVEFPDGTHLEIWCARPEDVVPGKLYV